MFRTGGKSKSVQIEVRKKRTFVKRDPQEAERLAAEEQARVKRKSKPIVRQKKLPSERRN
ncbi:hypothetical protein DMH27_23985 [Raoultella planticola]|nr:hypothetical protein [Raoultella planticola]